MQWTEEDARWMHYLTLGMIALGVVVRILQFAFYRPLWYDENALAYNLINRSLIDLLKPLVYDQAAPPGFLILEKVVIQILGVSTYALRLVPLLAGIGAVILVWGLARRVAPNAAPLIVGLFATSNWLIYYSTETKQYSLDVFVAAGLLLMLDRLRTGASRRDWVFAAALGALSVWISHPSVFVLAGGSLVLLIVQPALRRRQIILSAVWALSFIAAYLLLYRITNANAGLATYWADDFFHPDLAWNINALVEVFVLAAGIGHPVVFILVVVGVIIGVRTLPRQMTALMLAPIAITYIASILQKYPFNGRLLLFVLPGLMIVIGAGLQALVGAITGNRMWLAAILYVLLLLPAIIVVDTHQTWGHVTDTIVPLSVP